MALAGGARLGTGQYVRQGLGVGVADGTWRTFVRDLQADLRAAQPTARITKVNAFLVSGSGRVDDIRLRNEAPTTYEDAEDGTTRGWDIYVNAPAGATISNVFDVSRNSRVIQLSGSGTDNGYRLRSDSLTGWGNASQIIIAWSMLFTEYFMVFVDVETTAGQRYLMYTPVNQSTLGTGQYVRHGLGTGVIDGTWRTFVRDLQADLAAAQPTAKITKVNAFLIRGSGRVDDIVVVNR